MITDMIITRVTRAMATTAAIRMARADIRTGP